MIRSRWLPTLAGLALLSATGCERRPAGTAPRLVIENVVLVSPGTARGAPVSVAIEGDRIVAIGADVKARSGDSVIAGGGRFLTPGLIDGHVHLGAPAGLPFTPPPELVETTREYFEQLPRSYLYHGFTTVVDLGGFALGQVDRLRAAPAHPDIYGCGASVPLENGYPMLFAPPELRAGIFPNYLDDPRQGDRGLPPDSLDRSPRAAVDRAVGAGGICIKTYYEDGFGDTNDWPTPTAEMIVAVRDAARAKHVPLAIHANARTAWQFAAAVPVDLIAHGMWNWDGERPATGGALPGSIVAILDTVISRKIGFMPTLRVIEGLADLYDSTFLADPRLARVVPAGAIAWYRSPAGTALGAEQAGGRPAAAVRAMLEGAAEGAAEVARYLVERNGRLVFGSDTPSGPTYANPPGLNGYLELERLAAARIPLDRLLAAATIEAARAFRLDSLYGTIEPRKVANLLLLSRDPLESVTAWDAIDVVISRGQPIERSALAMPRR